MANSDKVKDDFRNFLYLCWAFLGLPNPTPLQYDIAAYLQHGPKRLMVSAFRGIGKSWITSAYALWKLYVDPERKILVVSASKDRADAFSTFTRRLIQEWPLLHHLKATDDQRNSNVTFDVGPCRPAHAPSVKSVGITGQMTGSRATDILADDIESLNNSETQLKRERLLEVIKEFEAILVPDLTDARICYLGTPQTEDSIYSSLPERGYGVRIWPARYPTEEQVARYGDRLAPIIRERMGLLTV